MNKGSTALFFLTLESLALALGSSNLHLTEVEEGDFSHTRTHKHTHTLTHTPLMRAASGAYLDPSAALGLGHSRPKVVEREPQNQTYLSLESSHLGHSPDPWSPATWWHSCISIPSSVIRE